MELWEIREQWQQTFGQDLAIGFVIKDAEIPMLKRCLAVRSTRELDEYLDNLPADTLY